MSRKIRTSSFRVTDPAGRESLVEEFTEMTEVKFMSEANRLIAGTKSYRTTGGHHVNRQDDGTFLDVTTGATLTRV